MSCFKHVSWELCLYLNMFDIRFLGDFVSSIFRWLAWLIHTRRGLGQCCLSIASPFIFQGWSCVWVMEIVRSVNVDSKISKVCSNLSFCSVVRSHALVIGFRLGKPLFLCDLGSGVCFFRGNCASCSKLLERDR
jgi:hypothetical protein